MPSKHMTIVDKLPIAIASLSVGRATKHNIEPKLKAIAEAGFYGVEVFYEDLKVPAQNTAGCLENNLLHEARIFRATCDAYNLTVTCLQPFKNYEGLLSRERHAEKITKLKTWLKIAAVLKTDLIMVPSMFHTDPAVATGDEATIAQDLREIADLGAAFNPPIRFAYEAMAWGAHVSSWQDAWRMVKKANRPNLGLCLDSFQVLAKVWADPTSIDGKKENADDLLGEDCKQLLERVPTEKIFYVQIADGMRLDEPLTPDHPWYNPAQHPTLTWSRNARLFPGEAQMGAYLPVFQLLKVWLLDMGYRGFLGFEIFNQSLFESGESTIVEHAVRGMESWDKCIEVLKLDSIASQPTAPLSPIFRDIPEMESLNHSPRL